MSFFKKAIKEEYLFIWNDKIYDLRYPNDEFSYQYELFTPVLKEWMNSEWMLIKSNTSIPISNQLIFQFAKISINNIALLEYRPYLINISKDIPPVTTFNRFLDTLNIIHCICDPKFIDMLKMRFYKSCIERPCGYLYDSEGEPEPSPSKEDWIYCINKFPWIWILPHLQILFNGNVSIQKDIISIYQQQKRP